METNRDMKLAVAFGDEGLRRSRVTHGVLRNDKSFEGNPTADTATTENVRNEGRTKILNGREKSGAEVLCSSAVLSRFPKKKHNIYFVGRRGCCLPFPYTYLQWRTLPHLRLSRLDGFEAISCIFP